MVFAKSENDLYCFWLSFAILIWKWRLLIGVKYSPTVRKATDLIQSFKISQIHLLNIDFLGNEFLAQTLKL